MQIPFKGFCGLLPGFLEALKRKRTWKKKKKHHIIHLLREFISFHICMTRVANFVRSYFGSVNSVDVIVVQLASVDVVSEAWQCSAIVFTDADCNIL